MLEFDPVVDYNNLRTWLRENAPLPEWKKEDLHCGKDILEVLGYAQACFYKMDLEDDHGKDSAV